MESGQTGKAKRKQGTKEGGEREGTSRSSKERVWLVSWLVVWLVLVSVLVCVHGMVCVCGVCACMVWYMYVLVSVCAHTVKCRSEVYARCLSLIALHHLFPCVLSVSLLNSQCQESLDHVYLGKHSFSISPKLKS